MLRYIVLLMVGACTIPVENFPERGATAMCDKLDECGELNVAYNNCHRFWRGAIESWIDAAESLNYVYDPAGARECVRSVETLSCEERESWSFEENCDGVFR